MTDIRLLVVAAALGLGSTSDGRAAGMVNAVPPAEYRPAAVARKAEAALVAPGAKALRIELPEPAAELRAMRADSAAATPVGARTAPKQRPRVIGVPREVPAALRTTALAGLEWQVAADGSRSARIEVRSAGAAGMRLALATDGAGLALRFAGNAPGAAVHGPFAAQAIADAIARDGAFVTPVLDGDTAIVELTAAPGTTLVDAALVLGTASHLTAAGAALRDVAPKSISDIGTSGACNVDLACVTPPTQALQQAGNSVGKVVFSDRAGFTYACSGTLLNDAAGSFAPYLFTSAHCIESAYEAATTNVYWFFKAQACGSVQVPPFVLQGGGAALLARSDDWDWALLRLNRMPPAGVFYSAWRAEPVPALAVGTGLHHPNGDLTKFSQGASSGYHVFPDASSFVRMQWSQGTTEVGSSGSGLFTFLPEGGYYELRGALYGGEASCSNRAGPDYYSRLDNMLPLVRQYLTPGAPNPAGGTVVVEYLHRSLRHYFITADPREVDALDSGTIVGWERTGVRFLAYAAPRAGTNPVCRYYLTPAVGNSHFYSAEPAECARVGVQYAGTWIHESSAVFHIALPHPVSGACPAGTRALWRFFNPGTTNHRYTPEVTLRDEMRASPAWIAEGYGPDAVIMCSPTGADP